MTSLEVSSSTAEPYDPCPVTPVIEVVFSRWTTPVLWLLQQNGRMRFNELRDQLGTVTAKTLTHRLRQLERDGLIDRVQYQQVPPRSHYVITELGLSLSPAFRLLVGWSDENMPRVRRSRQRYDASGQPRPS